MTGLPNLTDHGFCLVPTTLSGEMLNTLRDTLFHDESAGERCLRDHPPLLMRPLSLHASSQATTPKHRRVLHLVYHSGGAIPEPWHRAI